MSIEQLSSKYPQIPFISDTWIELAGIEGVDLIVKRNDLTNYGQMLSKNFQTFIANYFIYMVRAKFPEVKISIIKHIVFEHILDAVLSHKVQPAMDGNIAFSLSEEAQGNIRALSKPLILEIRNRLPSFPMTKETLNKALFGIIPALRHILVKYEALIEENPQTQPGLLEQSEQTNPPNRKRPKKKKVKKNKMTSKDNEKKFVPPRLFSLFSKPSLHWRFINIDSRNLDIRCLSSAEYYDMNGNVYRQKMEKESKRRSNVETVEKQIPSSKTMSIDHYKMYMTHMLQHMEVLFDFYSFETARINWLNYVGSQRAVENTVNILINGSKNATKKEEERRKEIREKEDIFMNTLYSCYS
ncbi:uncharacterized protein BX663DRAFT_499815 [Cokeromyces recurvatus]|uniref:uncharacterized protein n=1 Tax=Cokeromyces recurvatus TaxID=90255 RepID=UPI002220E246|nr:uncharacterized protein BX663DRAFT_499815 [Cokeromyces recurvatus]KAI7905470.1 hypothetical protein BX663DRAFT_499815 [Cokeromyces recurvatus]